MSENLRAYIAMKWLDPRLVMNELQEHGAVSDNAINVSDVGDGGAAIAFLEKRDQRALKARETATGRAA